MTILAVLRKQTMRRRFTLQRLTRPLDSLKLVRDEHNTSLLLPTVYTTFSLHVEALKGSWERGVFESGFSLLVVQWSSGLRLDNIRIEPFSVRLNRARRVFYDSDERCWSYF